VADLSEYVYCPRAQYYRRHPERSTLSVASVRERELGERYHARYLEREVASDGSSSLALLALAAGLLLLGAAVVVGFLR
jgi:CRISPR/Cas system-associated exonuclease Cas4 (RecB family)